MIKINFKYSYILILLLLFNCKQTTEKDQKESPNEIRLLEQKEPILTININFPDTVNIKIQEGSLTFRRELPDTLNLKPEDERFLTLYVNYFSSSDNPEIIREKLCDTFVAYSKAAIEKPVELKFWVINKDFKGEKRLRGKLVDQTILHSYSDSGKVRILEEVFYLDKRVYFPNRH